MSNSMRHLHWLLGAIVALVATAALAGEITLYQHPGFQGRNITTGDAVPNLARAGFNDPASSIVVRSGIWEVCTDAYFHGNCATLMPGEYRRIDSTLNDRISSARQIGYEPVPPRAVVTSPPVAVVTPPPVAAAAPPPVDMRIVLSEHTRSGVKSVELTDGVRDLDSVGFSNRADSATVYGGVWRLCDREGGTGTTCVEFGPGYYDHLGALDRNVRSALVVGEARAAVAVPVVAPRVVLYEFPDFAGRSLAIEGSEARDLMWQRFAARAGSIRVFGGSWMFCTAPNFSGECRTLGPGEYPRLGPDLDRRIASARLVSNAYVGMR